MDAVGWVVLWSTRRDLRLTLWSGVSQVRPFMLRQVIGSLVWGSQPANMSLSPLTAMMLLLFSCSAATRIKLPGLVEGKTDAG